MPIRTSESDPLRIAALPVGGGLVGVTLCPGKQGDSVFGAGWARGLASDVAAMRDWGASAVVTLIEEHEFEMLGVQALPEAVRARRPAAKGAQGDRYQRAFLLPGVPAIHQEASIVMPKGLYQASGTLELIDGGKPFVVRMNHVKQRGVDFDRITYEAI